MLPTSEGNLVENRVAESIDRKQVIKMLFDRTNFDRNIYCQKSKCLKCIIRVYICII